MAFEKQFSSPHYKQTLESRYLTGELSLTLILNGEFLGAGTSVICVIAWGDKSPEASLRPQHYLLYEQKGQVPAPKTLQPKLNQTNQIPSQTRGKISPSASISQFTLLPNNIALRTKR